MSLPTGALAIEAFGHPAPPEAEPDDIDDWLLRAVEPSASDDRTGGPIPFFQGDVPAEETKSLRFRTAREIASSTSEQVQFAAAYLAFGAITELDGKPKAAGKTTFLLDMVRAILDGAAFLGQATVRGPIVMLTEQPPASLKAALVRAGLTTRDDFIFLSWADAAGTPWPAIVAAAAAECRRIGARVLIVDTLPQFAGLRGDSENNSGDALEAVEPLQLLAADGFAILVSRHDRKSGGDVGDSARGSGAFTGAVDIVVALARDAHDARPTMRHLACLSRFSETPPDLVVELVDGRYVVVGTTAEALAAAQRERVLTALANTAEPQRVEAVADLVGEPPKAVRELLNELYAEGLVVREGAGKKGEPYQWSRPLQSGIIPFVPLRVTNERNESRPLPGAVVDEGLPVESDYPRSAYAYGIEDE